MSPRAWGLVAAFVVPALSLAAFIAVPGASGQSAETAPDRPPPLRLGVVHAGRNPRTIDLASVVPRGGTLDHVWFVPATSGAPQLAVAWQRPPRPRSKRWAHEEGRHWQLTLWNPQGKDQQGVRWLPHVLVAASPFPIADYFGRSAVRLADGTRDGHDELLVSIGCTGCNHGTTVISVFATVGGHVRRIYGNGRWNDPNDPGTLRGRTIHETRWGARDGKLWFDEPRGGQSVGCPAFRLYYELRWTGNGWRLENVHRIRHHYP